MFEYQSCNTWQKYFAHSRFVESSKISHIRHLSLLCAMHVAAIYNTAEYVQMLS